MKDEVLANLSNLGALEGIELSGGGDGGGVYESLPETSENRFWDDRRL